jgi:hypothetical protein
MATRRVLNALFVVGVSVCLLLLVTPFSFADSHARIVRLSDIEGTVQIDRNTGQGFEKAIENMPITQGVRLETGISGRAEVEFENGSVLHLTENSSVEFTQLSLRSEGQRLTELRVNDGTVYVNFKKQGGDDFRVDVANRSLDLNRDVHFRLRLNNATAEIAVFRGELGVEGNGESAKVKKNETFNLDLSDGARYELAKGITNLDSDDWDSERNNYETQYASNYNSRQYPYQYGYSDLNYYGGFSNAPGYGSLWRPYGVGPGWDPFADGAWAYYPGQGYMWVSSYPWGWTPYRYGQWVFVPNYGWGWQPGYWNQWNAVPVVVNPPSNWHRPSPPPITGGTHGGGTIPTTVVVGRPPATRPGRTITTDTITGRPIPGSGVTSLKANPERSGRQGKDAESQAPKTGTAATSVVPDRGTRGQAAVAPTQPKTPAPEVESSHPSRAVVTTNPPAGKTQEVRPDRGGRDGRSVGNASNHPAPAVAPAPAPASRSAAPAPAPARTSPAPAPHTSAPAPRSMSGPARMGGGAPHMSMPSASAGGGGRPSPKH